MKKIILPFILLLQFYVYSFASGTGERFIVFFAESADIAENVADKILLSKRFCMAMPVTSGGAVAAGLEELVSKGRIEPSLVFEPEPVFPILASVYSSGIKKSEC